MKIRTGTDYYFCEDLLSEEEKAIRDEVRDWVQSRYLPKASEWFERGTFPLELVPEMSSLKLFGIELKDFGCPGMNNIAYGLICQELERGDSGLRSFISVMMPIKL